MKKGLVVVYDPHALLEFLEFLCMGDYEAEWDALCLPQENGTETMSNACAKSGVFKEVFIGNTEYLRISTIKKAILFARMLFFALVGKKRSFASKLISEYVGDIARYDYFASNIDTGFISGMLALFAPERKVFYFDDGFGDYTITRKKWDSIFAERFLNFQSVIMARLGYFGKGYTWLETTKNTIKYCSAPQKLKYRNFSEIKRLELDDGKRENYSYLLSKTFPYLEHFRIDGDCAVVFTVPNDVGVERWKEYISEFAMEIGKQYSNILLKRHPRENSDILDIFKTQVKEVTEIPQSVPAEAILPYLNGNRCFFMMADSVFVPLGHYDTFAEVLYYEKHVDSEFDYSLVKMINICEDFMKGRYKIKRIM